MNITTLPGTVEKQQWSIMHVFRLDQHDVADAEQSEFIAPMRRDDKFPPLAVL